MGISIPQLVLILLIVLLLFGAGRLPRVMSDLARGVKAFKKGLEDNESIEPQAPTLAHRLDSGLPHLQPDSPSKKKGGSSKRSPSRKTPQKKST